MKPADTIKTLMAALDSGDIELAKSLLSDNFQISGPFPSALNKEQWMGIQAITKKAFPDWSFNLSRVEDHGDTCTAYYQITGTHRGDLDLSPMGVPVIPATGKTIKLPAEHADFSFQEGKIAAMKVHGAEGGGLPGLLRQLGVKV